MTTPGYLATQLDLDPAIVTRSLRQLEVSGLVARGRRDDDGRVSTVEATAAGREAFQRVRDVIWDQVRRAISDWPVSELDQLADLLSQLVSDVQRESYRKLSPISRP
jgi:DNA-binding MarR family transcriptional regulator